MYKSKSQFNSSYSEGILLRKKYKKLKIMIKPAGLHFVPDQSGCGMRDNLLFYCMRKKEYRGQIQKLICMQIFSLYVLFLFYITTYFTEWLQYTKNLFTNISQLRKN